MASWNKAARTAAAKEYGKQNYQRYAARRRLGGVLLLGGAAVLMFGSTVSDQLGGQVLAVTGIVLGVVLLLVLLILAIRQLGRPPRGGFRGGMWDK